MTVRMLAIHGSARAGGNSRALLDVLLSAATAAHSETDVELVRAYDSGVDPCIDCGGCEEDQVGCIRHHDGWHALESALRSADILVIATPVYFMGPPAPLKAIIDRLQALWWHRKRGGEVATNSGPFRRAGLILTAAGDDPVFAPTRRIVVAALNTLDFGLVGTVLGGGLDEPGDASSRDDLLDLARGLGHDLVRE
jgi:NAD(P)H-dependent FMN reductase